METATQWGLEWIIAIQAAFGPAARPFFEAVTFMGEEYFYLVVVPILFWSVDAAVGARVGFAFLISSYTNVLFKDMFNEPRPYQIDISVSDLEVPGSGMPSGHAQSSIFVWGVLAAQVGRWWFWGIAFLMAFLIGLSRVALGVHFPHQVVTGWIAGAILLVLFLWLDPRVERFVGALPLGQQLAVTIMIPVLLAVVYPHNDTVASAAVMGGFSTGIVLTRHYMPFTVQGLWWQRILRSVIGLAILIALYVGLSTVFPGQGETAVLPYFLFRFLRYAILGLWIGLGAPWLFRLLRLQPAAFPEEKTADQLETS